MKTAQQPWFETQRIRDDLYRITEPLYTRGNRANLWLIKGRDADLLIDTGLGAVKERLWSTPRSGWMRRDNGND